MFHPFRFRLTMAALIASGALVAGHPAPAIAQEGDDPPSRDEDDAKPAEGAKGAAWTKVEQDADKGYKDSLKAGGAFDGAARDFVVKRAVPQLANESNKSILDRVRRRIREVLLGPITDDRAFDDASKAVADAALEIVRDRDASAAARVNAMLLVGDLRAKEGKEGTVWSPAAALLAGVAGDPSVDASVRVAAVAGLVRHADAARRAGGDRSVADFAKAARAAVVAIVSEPAPKEPSVASDWLLSRSLGLVPAVVKPAPKELAAALVGVMGDSNRSLDVRIRAAAALGATVAEKSEIQPVEAVGTITTLALATLEADEGLLRDRRYEQELGGGGGTTKSPMMGMQAPGGMGGMSGPVVPQLIPEQALRRTAWRLVTLADALLTEDGKAGVATLLSGEDLENSKAYAGIYREQGVAIDEERTDDALLTALATLRPDETAAVADDGEAPAAAPAADDSDPFGGK